MSFIPQNFDPGLITGLALTGLGDQSFTNSGPIYNNSGLSFITANIQIQVTTGGTGSTTGSVVCYISRSVDTFTFDDFNFNLQPLGTFTIDASVVNTYTFSVDTDIIGTLPPAFQVVVYNNTGDTWTGGTATYCGKQYYAF